MYPEEIDPDTFFFSYGIIFHKCSGFPDAASVRQDIFCYSGRSGGSGRSDCFSVCSLSQDQPVTDGSWQHTEYGHLLTVFPQNQDR